MTNFYRDLVPNFVAKSEDLHLIILFTFEFKCINMACSSYSKTLTVDKFCLSLMLLPEACILRLSFHWYILNRLSYSLSTLSSLVIPLADCLHFRVEGNCASDNSHNSYICINHICRFTSYPYWGFHHIIPTPWLFCGHQTISTKRKIFIITCYQIPGDSPSFKQ